MKSAKSLSRSKAESKRILTGSVMALDAPEQSRASGPYKPAVGLCGVLQTMHQFPLLTSAGCPTFAAAFAAKVGISILHPAGFVLAVGLVLRVILSGAQRSRRTPINSVMPMRPRSPAAAQDSVFSLSKPCINLYF
jgi:hypothetical protein